MDSSSEDAQARTKAALDATYSGQLPFVPAADELNTLRQHLAQEGLIDLDTFKPVCAQAAEMERCTAYDALLSKSAARMASNIIVAHRLDRPSERVHFTAFKPNGSMETLVAHLDNPDEESKTHAFLLRHIGLSNIYVGLNPAKDQLPSNQRPASEHIATSVRAALDIDRGKKESCEAFKARIAPLLDLAKRLDASHIVNTGGGVQIYFCMMPITDPAAMAARTKMLNAAFRPAGSDPVNDPPRFLRQALSINIPNKNKRENRGRNIALAHTMWRNNNPRVWPDDDLCREWAAGLGLVMPATSPNLNQSSGSAAVALQGLKSADLAPSLALACAALKSIPNTGHYDDRDKWIALCAEFHGATGGHPDARAEWLDWCATWSAGGDPDEDARVWDTMRNPRRSWSHLLASVKVHDAAAAAKLVFTTLKETGASDEEAQLAADQFLADGGGGQREARAFLATQGLKLFKSEDGRRYCEFRGDVQDLDAGDVSSLMGHLIRAGFRLSKQGKVNLFEELRDEASISNDVRAVHVRFALRNGLIYVDNVGEDGGVAIIRPGGYAIEPRGTGGVCFYRPTTQKRIVTPSNDGSRRSLMSRLRNIFSLPAVTVPQSADDEGVRAEAALFMLFFGILYHQGTKPIGAFTGPQGTGKSVALQRVKAVLDPTDPDRTAMPSDVKGLFITAYHAGVASYDNSSEITGAVSDAACCITSGTAYQDRQLFTNGGQFTMKVHRAILLSSVLGNVTDRPDFLDRTVSVPLIPPAHRRPERELEEAFEKERPALQHALFELMARALALLPQVEASFRRAMLPRLVDVALIAEAAAQAEGWQPGLLIDAANSTRHQAAEEQMDSNGVAVALRKVLNHLGGNWEGTADQLRETLMVVGGLPRTGPGSCPSPERLRSQLDRVKGPLIAQGWTFASRRTAAARLMRITAPALARARGTPPPFLAA